MKLSLCLATHNEEANIASCLESAKNLVDEIIIVDGSSTDRTVEIAKKYDARVIITENRQMFHINKQKALDAATGDWILQLDADERVSPELAQEIKKVIAMDAVKLGKYEMNLPEKKLFLRHQAILGNVGKKNGSYSAFFLPRLNYFLGTFLRHGGVYPDGAIRLIKKGKAYFPCIDVHEVMHVTGRVGWLAHPLFHYDSPTFRRYLERNSRYISLLAHEFQQKKLRKNPFSFMYFMLYKPFAWFFSTQIRHKGILDGWQGIIFSFFSALRFPRAYLQYLFLREKK